MSKKKPLKRGLEHLFEQANILDGDDIIEGLNAEELKNSIQMIKIDEIQPNPYQPRKEFEQKALEELASSIKINGIFQPLLVRTGVIGYEIISGERRFRASKLAELQEVPALVYEYKDEQMMEVGLLENIQREDLNIVEEARAYRVLMENLEYTQDKLAKRIAKSRSHIANVLRILNLDDNILKDLENNKLSFGHAKLLVSIKDNAVQKKVYEQISKKNLTVRETELYIKELMNSNEKVKQNKKAVKKKSSYERLENILEDKLGTKVSIAGKDKGWIKIEYLTDEDLERVLKTMNLLD